MVSLILENWYQGMIDSEFWVSSFGLSINGGYPRMVGLFHEKEH